MSGVSNLLFKTPHAARRRATTTSGVKRKKSRPASATHSRSTWGGTQSPPAQLPPSLSTLWRKTRSRRRALCMRCTVRQRRDDNNKNDRNFENKRQTHMLKKTTATMMKTNEPDTAHWDRACIWWRRERARRPRGARQARASLRTAVRSSTKDDETRRRRPPPAHVLHL